MKSTPLLFTLVLAPLVFGKGLKKPDWVIEKFESGKTMSKTLYQDNDLLEAESFFENGKSKVTTKRAGKSKKGYGPNDYNFKEHDDDGRIVAEGSCWGPPLQPLDPYVISNKPKLHYGSQHCNEMTGTLRKYSDKKELTSEIQFKDGKMEGEATFANEKSIQKITYAGGKKIKLVETDKETKKVLRSEEYYSDGSKK